MESLQSSLDLYDLDLDLEDYKLCGTYSELVSSLPAMRALLSILTTIFHRSLLAWLQGEEPPAQRVSSALRGLQR
jgi:hypothetical protein